MLYLNPACDSLRPNEASFAVSCAPCPEGPAPMKLYTLTDGFPDSD